MIRPKSTIKVRAKSEAAKSVVKITSPAKPKAPAIPHSLSLLRLPRAIEAHPKHEALETLLTQDFKPIWEEGTVPVSHLPFSSAFEEALMDTLRFKRLIRGLEQINQQLESEQKGLLALQAKQGTPPAHRTSRLLIMANDGAERFYRACESTLIQHSDRLLGVIVAVNSERLGLELFGPGKPVKALLVSDRDAVSNLLLSLLE